MARIFMTGAETGDQLEWTTFRGWMAWYVNFVVSNQVHTGSYSFFNSALYGDEYLIKTFDNALTTIYGSLWYRWQYYTGGWGDSWFGSTSLIWFRGPGKVQCGIGVQYNGILRAYAGMPYGTDAGDVYLASSPIYSVIYERWNLIEFKIVVHPTNGIFQVRINGIEPLAIDLTDVNTRGDVVANSNNMLDFRMGNYWRVNGVFSSWYDDIILDDVEWTNGGRIVRLPITHNGSSNVWVPSTGINYQCIDEVPANSADYISTSTRGASDLFTTSSMPGVSCNVKSVKVSAHASKDGGPSSAVLQTFIRSGLAIDQDAQRPLKYGDQLYDSTIFQTSPLTSLPFTIPEVNSLEWGVQFAYSGDLFVIPQQLSTLSLTLGFPAATVNDSLGLSGDQVITLGGDVLPVIDLTQWNLPGIYSASLKLNCINHNSESWFTLDIEGPKTLSFWWAVDSEMNCDYLRFYIDDVEQHKISGPSSPLVWAQKTYSIDSGSHTLKWRYSTDYSVFIGLNAGWVDSVQIT